MRSFKLTLAAFALLLAACSPRAEAQTPTATVAPATATTASPAAPQNTPQDTAQDAPTSAPTNTTAPVVINTPITASSQTTPAEASIVAATRPAATPAGVAAALSQEGEYANLDSPVDLLASYYNAVTRQEYERAYSYWQEPPLDYESFAGGYADTASVQVIVQPPTRIEGAAGSLYAEIPTFLIAQHHDGSVHSFSGCIVTRKSNIEEDVWHLYQARLAEVANNANIPALLATGCAS